MSRLASDDQLHSLEGLEGWGKLKKKLGLNKLKTRKALKAVNHAVKAVVVPTKKNLKNAEKKGKPHIGKILPVADLIVPGAGTAASLAWTKNRTDKAKKEIKAALAKHEVAMREAEAEAAAEAQAEAAQSAVSAAAAPAATASPAATEAEKKPNYLAWGVGGLLAIKALSLVV